MIASFLTHRYAVTAAALFALTAGTASAVTAPAQIQITAADLFAAGQFPFGPIVPITKAFGGAEVRTASSPTDFSVPSVPSPGFYPADLANPTNLPTLGDLTVHNVIINPLIPVAGTFAQSPTGPTLADADTFLNNLFASQFMQVADQYTGAGHVRTVGQAGVITFNSFKTTYNDPELVMFVHAAARTFGNSTPTMVNMFFKQGTDVCSTFGGTILDQACYSPDVPSTFAFCGYHSYIDFTDLGRVFFSVEPYDNVSGCRVPQGSPQGRAIDSMASVLSHETFEAITDPGLNAWFIRRGAFGGNEIGDICAFLFAGVNLNGTPYGIQAEYSNTFHACTFALSPPVN